MTSAEKLLLTALLKVRDEVTHKKDWPNRVEVDECVSVTYLHGVVKAALDEYAKLTEPAPPPAVEPHPLAWENH